MIKKIMLVLSAVFIISTFAGAGYIFLHRGRVNLSSAGAEAEKESGEADRPSQALSLTEKVQKTVQRIVQRIVQQTVQRIVQ